MTLYDLIGRLLENYNTIDKNGNWTINTTKYPKGIYLIVAKESEQVVSQQKLIIE